MPRVSVCLPNLNTFRYLPERLRTIFAQTLTDWELVVVDNRSEDGAWEYFLDQAKAEPRMRISQAPREGMYANWNNCIRQSRGEFIYIATSDDTMTPDCLEKLVNGLDAHPECDICTSSLITIDKDGREIPDSWKNAFVTQFFGDWMQRRHIRLAPHDGVLYCAERCVYTSITQLLLRRSIFDKVGLFRTDLGSEGDWEWEMRAALVCNALHLPEFVATWRIHPEQATKGKERSSTAAWHRSVEKMIHLALAAARPLTADGLRQLSSRRLTFCARVNAVQAELREAKNPADRLWKTLLSAFHNPDMFYYWATRKLRLRSFATDWDALWVRDELMRLSKVSLVVDTP